MSQPAPPNSVPFFMVVEEHLITGDVLVIYGPDQKPIYRIDAELAHGSHGRRAGLIRALLGAFRQHPQEKS